MKMKFIALTAACLLLVSPVLSAAPDSGPATELNADVISFSARTGVITAQGGLRMTQGATVITGEAGEYNTKTKAAVITGNVKVVKESATLTASEVQTFDEMTRFVAIGNAVLTHPSGSAAGPRMEYEPSRQYASITGGARLVNRDAVLTASSVEAFFSEDRATAEGNVHIVSEARKLEAVSDHAVYQGLNGKNGRADLTGNVRAVQDGAVLTGNHVILYMDDSAMDSQGRSKLVMQPQAKTEKDKP
jgi:lipopolysaccharide export system protein LptA